jgi:hypothetical protein
MRFGVGRRYCLETERPTRGSHHVPEPRLTEQVQLTFDVDPELQADFAGVVRGDGRFVGDVLIDLMRSYSTEACQRSATTTARPTSKADRRRRADAVNFARAALTLQGFQRSDEAKANAQRFICGDIELYEFLVPGCREMEERVRAFLVGAPWP